VRKNPQDKNIRRMCSICYQKKRQIFEYQEAKKNFKKTTTNIVLTVQNRLKCVILLLGAPISDSAEETLFLNVPGYENDGPSASGQGGDSTLSTCRRGGVVT
ncbi:unnamed protein product, partial [Heterotrigona itama]